MPGLSGISGLSGLSPIFGGDEFLPTDLGNDLLLWLRADQGVYTGGARRFYSADKGHLTIADNTALSLDGVSFTIAAWVYYDSHTAVNPGIVSKDASAGNGEWSLYRTANELALTVHNGSGYITAVSTGSKLVNNSQWYFVLGEYDGVNLSVSVNNGTAVTQACSAVRASTAAMTIGCYERTDEYHDGRIAKAGVWKRTLTTAEKTYLYNLGNGRVYGELGVAATDGSDLLTSMSAYWNLNESSGTANAIDQHSTNDLIPTFVELLSNVGYETAGGGGADIWANRTEAVNGTATLADELIVVQAGSHAFSTALAASGDYGQTTQAVLTSGSRYQYSVQARNVTGGSLVVLAGTASATHTLNTNYTAYTGTLTANGTGFVVRGLFNTLAGTVYADTESVKALDIPSAPGPESAVAEDTVGTNDAALINFETTYTVWSNDRPTPITTLVEGSLAFDGTNDYIELSSGITSGTTFSFSMWVKPNTQTESYGMLFGNSNGTTGLFYRGSGAGSDDQKVIWFGGVSILSTGTLTNDAWNHVVVSVASGVLTIYINGVARGSDTGVISTTLLKMGNDTSLDIFKGSLADVRFYSVAKSAPEILALFNGTDDTTSLLNRWPLDDGPGQTGLVTGDPTTRWVSLEGNNYNFLQGLASKRPAYDSAGINSLPALDFDGVDDILVANTAFLTGESGRVYLVYRLDGVPNTYQVLIASSDEASTARYLIAYGRGNNANNHLTYDQRNDDTADLLDGNTAVVVDTNYIGELASNATTIQLTLSGVLQTLTADIGANTGDWWDDSANKDNVTLGALKSTSEALFFGGKLSEVIVTRALTTWKSQAVRIYLANRYGIILP